MKQYKQLHSNAAGTEWYETITQHVDIETGEELTKTRANDKKQYTLIKTQKHETERTTTGKTILRYTKHYRRNPQQQLFIN